ncbi:unnamed protein product [Ostreobium quekettii]|uniref:FH2 domain-containing protein n=1 Tax=Ostreobium quekettii TaxID=121088 RepID=A0A8S1IZY7_9CHLO|nr:unnamed protein product [Ostreobium quekettii]
MLESLFRNPAWAGASSSKSKPAPVAGGPEGRPTMIDIRRANNVSIMMTRFKAFPGGVGGMMHAVLSFQGLTWEEMGLIRQIAPKKGERKDFKDFGGAPQDLTAAERVLLQMNQVPRLKAKCRVALFIMKWEELRNESVQALDTVQAACQELRRSSRLQSVLSCALTVSAPFAQHHPLTDLPLPLPAHGHRGRHFIQGDTLDGGTAATLSSPACAWLRSCPHACFLHPFY